MPPHPLDMVEQEVHDTLHGISVSEKLTFELEITESAYKSDQALEGELQVYAKPNDQVVYNRRSPPKNAVAQFVADGLHETAGFPGTSLFLALSADPIVNTESENLGLEGITDDTTSLTIDWDVDEAERLLADDERKVVYEDMYRMEQFASEDRPFVVRGELYPDAREVMENREHMRRLLEKQNRNLVSLEGLATLSITIEHKSNIPDPIHIDEFHLDMAQTFPEIDFLPFKDATYDPEHKRIEWRNRTLAPNDVVTYNILGPIEQLLGVGEVSATLDGSIAGSTMGQVRIEGIYDSTGGTFPQYPQVDKGVDIQCSIRMDPDALRGEVQTTSGSQINIPLPPEDTYERLINICKRESLHIRDRSPPSDEEPITGQEGVFSYASPGELEIKRQYGDEGTVYGDITVEGRFTAVSQTNEVSAFDREQDRVIREDEGAMERRGQSQIDVRARSTSSELNARLIDTIEEGLRGGDQPALSGGR